MFFTFALVTVGFILIDAGITKRSIIQVINGEQSTRTTNSASGQTTATTSTSNVPVTASGSAAARIRTMQAQANKLVGRPYVWGGGHSITNWLNAAGYDCSGFVSAVLGAGGFLTSPQTTQTLPGQPNIANGPGRYVTIYDNTSSSNPAQDHVIIDIAGQWYESGGSFNPTGGVSHINKPPSSYLAQFNRLLHPAGL